MPDRPTSRIVRPGEILALKPEALHPGPQGFFWMFGPSGPPPNERRGSVAIVHIRDALDHHADSWSDNYEAIVQRVRDAMTGADEAERYKIEQQRHDWRNSHKEGYEPLPDRETSKPSAVLMCIDSPGGVVSGCFDAVAALRSLAKEHKVKLVSYVNTTCASAAYALACSGSEIVCPRFAIVGSIGVISTTASQAAKDKKDGYDFRLITSGARKSDGHPHVPISDAAVAAEQDRVTKIAADFFKLVGKARGMSPERVKGLEASVYLGPDAKKRGLVDAVRTLDETIAALESEGSAKIPLDSASASRSPSSVPRTNNVRNMESRMPVSLTVKIQKTQAAIAAETDPVKLAALAADLTTYAKAAKDCDDDEEEDDDDEEEKKAKKAKKAEADEKKAKEAKEAKDKAAAPVIAPSAVTPTPTLASLLGLSGDALEGRLTALLEKAEAYDALAGDVAQMKADTVTAKRNALIDEAVAQRRVTRKQAESLRGKKLAYVEQFLEMHPTALVNIDEDALHVPDGTPAADIPANVKKIIEQAVVAQGLSGDAAEKFRTEAYADQRKVASKSEVH